LPLVGGGRSVVLLGDLLDSLGLLGTGGRGSFGEFLGRVEAPLIDQLARCFDRIRIRAACADAMDISGEAAFNGSTAFGPGRLGSTTVPVQPARQNSDTSRYKQKPACDSCASTQSPGWRAPK